MHMQLRCVGVSNSENKPVLCPQKKEPLGDSEELPEDVHNSVESITPEILQVGDCCGDFGEREEG